jgi:diadenosine tetraphosphate (Ap4A) HIT family hydrolase
MTPLGCPMCAMVGAEGEQFIADLEMSRAYLNPDQFFAGWTWVVLRRHATELYELTRSERSALVEDVTRVAEALARVLVPVKMNYELLGNQVAHIHWHLVPRLPGDPDPRWPVWRLQHAPTSLEPGARQQRIAAIRRALDERSPPERAG